MTTAALSLQPEWKIMYTLNCSKKMRNFCDSAATRDCEKNKPVVKTSQKCNFMFNQCNIKDVELVKPTRYNLLQSLYTASPKPAPNNIILVMDDGLYLLSQTDRIDKSLKWKPISQVDKSLYKEVMHAIRFESSMSSVGLGNAETHVPSHVRELCLERFRPKMCNVGLSTKPEYRSCSNQTKIETHDISTQFLIEQKHMSINAVVSTMEKSTLAVRDTKCISTGTDDLAGGDVQRGNRDIEEVGQSSTSRLFQNTAPREKSIYEESKNIISISIKGKTVDSNFNVASMKIVRNEPSVECDREDDATFSISDEDLSAILTILKKAKNRLSKKVPTEEQARERNITTDTEENKNLGAIPKRPDNSKIFMKTSTLATQLIERIPVPDKIEIKEDTTSLERNTLHTEYHLDPPFQFKPGLSLFSPFQAFGYNASTNLPLSLSRVKIPIVEKRHLDLEDLNQIGSGDYGSVYTARHVVRSSLVCVKEFDMERSDRFDVFMEAKILSYLKSTCCVPECYGLMESPSNPNHLALVQEYFGDGVTLKKVLLECPTTFTYKQWINVCLQLLIGLHKIHSSHVVINDVKCDNILVDLTGEDPDNCIRYIDFGFSTFRQGFSYPWDPDYMRQFRHIAPEVKSGRPTTPGSDLFSLGCVLKAVCNHAGIISMDPIAGMCMQPDPCQRPATVDVMERVRALHDSLD